VVLNLRTHYKPLSTIATEIGMDWQHLNRLARGDVAEPRFNSGLRLLNLHEKHCKHLHTLEIIGK
jgi:hypothetical protein